MILKELLERSRVIGKFLLIIAYLMHMYDKLVNCVCIAIKINCSIGSN